MTHRRNRRRDQAAAAAAALTMLLQASSAPLEAATASANLAVGAAVISNCTVATTALSFGSYDPVVAHAAADLEGSGSLTVACTKGTVPVVGLGLGTGALGLTRRMTDGAGNFLTYGLFQDSGRTTVWSLAGLGLLTLSASPSKSARVFTVYGRVAAGQDVPAGAYSDTVVALVNFSAQPPPATADTLSMRQRSMKARSPAGRWAGRWVVMAAALAGLAAVPRGAAAQSATFTVNPTRIQLADTASSALLRLRNESRETLRFQLSVFAWAQSPSGEMKLEPTDDIVFFPPLLTLGPSEERRVRVGSATRSGAVEKTYRIFVEELPPLERPQAGGAVRVLTKMGIPIFLRPAKQVATATLSGLRREDGRLRFTLANTGTVHFVPEIVTVRAVRGGEPAFTRELQGWYVLAGGHREFETALPDADCAAVTALVVEVTFASGRVEERLQTPSGACAP